MSTTFGVITKSGKTIPVARRFGTVFFTNELAELLPKKTKVVSLDNTAQGIYTIGDIKNAIKKRVKKEKRAKNKAYQQSKCL